MTSYLAEHMFYYTLWGNKEERIKEPIGGTYQIFNIFKTKRKWTDRIRSLSIFFAPKVK